MGKSLVFCFLSVTNFTFTYSESSYEIVISQSMNSLIHIQHDYTACVNTVTGVDKGRPGGPAPAPNCRAEKTFFVKIEGLLELVVLN